MAPPVPPSLLLLAVQARRGPNGPKVGLATANPRGDLRVPSDAKPTLWLDDILDNVPESLDA